MSDSEMLIKMMQTYYKRLINASYEDDPQRVKNTSAEYELLAIRDVVLAVAAAGQEILLDAVAAEREACIEDARTVGGTAGAEMEKLILARNAL